MEEVIVEKETLPVPKPVSEIAKTNKDIDSYIKMRKTFIKKVNAICVEGKDYHVIQNKKSLAKGGAEKIASIFKWTAKFERDNEAIEMLGNVSGLVAFKCTLCNGGYVGEGRGAAMLGKNNGDPNKTLKMAQKSAFIDAVLRSSGLSDFFTQDIEDMPSAEIGGTPQADPITPSQYGTMCKLYEEKIGPCTEAVKKKIEGLTKREASAKIGEYIRKPNRSTEEDGGDPGDPNNEPPVTDEWLNKNVPDERG